MSMLSLQWYTYSITDIEHTLFIIITNCIININIQIYQEKLEVNLNMQKRANIKKKHKVVRGQFNLQFELFVNIECFGF